MTVTFDDWVRQQVAAEPYWFQRIQVLPNLVTPGWSNPVTEKLPYYGLPGDMAGLRVLDVGCAEGFFSFEAARRGAAEVVAIDSFPDSIRRFNICRAALRSPATPFLCNVYDLTPTTFGTFDVVMFFGVLYHLRHPLLALERLRSVCAGSLLLQTATYEIPGIEDVALAKFHPNGLVREAGGETRFDPTIFWFPNAECTRALVEAAGFRHITILERMHPMVSCVLHAQVPEPHKGVAPDQRKAPWS